MKRIGVRTDLEYTSSAKQQWRLLEDYSNETDDGKKIFIPEGFTFDLASVPEIFWSIIAPFELGEEAPLIHDWIYIYRGKPPYPPIPQLAAKFTRKEADQLFRMMMKVEGVSWWRRNQAYFAVRAFGWWPFYDFNEGIRNGLDNRKEFRNGK